MVKHTNISRSYLSPTKVYVAGPMRGIPLFNFPAFEHAAKVLRARGFYVVSPAEEDIKQDDMKVDEHGDYGKPPHSFSHYMKRDLAIVCDMDAVAVLPGWEKSQGARLEVYVARALGLPVFSADTGEIIPPEAPQPRTEAVASAIPVGIGGAPLRASILPAGGADRKKFPIASGVLDYFPDAICAIAEVSKAGNDQHNPGKALNWDRSKSGDHADTIGRHFLQRGMRDADGLRHSAKLAWRSLALLQEEIEGEAQ